MEALESELHEARSSLLAAAEGVTDEEFVREASEGGSVRDLLWHAGLLEDWTRRTVSLASAGRALPAFHALPRPEVTSDASHLRAWLEQCRRPTLALLRRLADDDLGREFTLLDGHVTTARALLRRIAAHDRDQAEAVRALRGRPVALGEGE